MIGRGDLRGRGGGGCGRCKQHIKHMFFDLLQLLRGFSYGNDHLKKDGQVLNKPQMRLLLKISGGAFYQIETDI